MSTDRPRESRTWDIAPDEAERLLDELRSQIDKLKAQITVYRAVVGEEPAEPPGGAPPHP
jgi:hypothetical protein